jgi:signal transduction histidine kinase
LRRQAAIRLASRLDSTVRRGTEARPAMTPLEGMDQAIHALAEVIRMHRRADLCAIAVQDPHTDDLRLYRADPKSGSAARGKRLDPESGLPELLAPRTNEGFIFNRRSPRSCLAAVCVRGRPALPRAINGEPLGKLAEMLEADSLISVPLRMRDEIVGRLLVGSRQVRYGVRDLRTFTALADQAGLMVENVRLVGRLALEVAHEERRRISRDLHDGTIQPYIGLKLGLEALRRRLNGDARLAHEVDELLHMASDGIGELRQYVGTLKGRQARRRSADLVPAIRLQAQKFSDFYGIETRVLAEDDVLVTSALHEEVIHIVREGLSNIRRHTRARRAIIRLRPNGRELLLELINDKAVHRTRRLAFMPRSISERVRELGGRVEVEHRHGARTVVSIQLPL